MNASHSTLLHAIWDSSDRAAALITIFLFLTTLFGWVRWYIHGRLKSTEDQIRRLKRDIDVREKELDEKVLELQDSRKRCAQIENRLPEAALGRAENELREGNYAPANRAVLEWVRSEGSTVSMLIFRRAEWITAHSAGDIRALGLVAAEAYATAAIAVCPQNIQVRSLLVDLRGLQREEGQLLPPMWLALEDFDRQADQLFNSDLASAAGIAEREAIRRYKSRHYVAALLIVNLALSLQVQTIGKNSQRTLRTQNLQAEILTFLGRYHEALSIARSVTDAKTAHPDLGPNHPETLFSRYLVAMILSDLGRSKEALPIAQSVADMAAAHADLGPNHPNTLASRHLVALIFYRLGRSKEALPIAQSVADAEAAHPDLGPNHPETLVNSHLVAMILEKLGRSKEGLAIAESVADMRAAHADLGPNHHDTLFSCHLVAHILDNLGRSKEALSIAQSVADMEAAHPDLGPNHPETLGSRRLLAYILDGVGRSEEALSIAQSVADMEAAHPDLGPNHPNTLASRRVVAVILDRLGRSKEALPIAQSVADTQAAHPDLGPSHPDTLGSGHLGAVILRQSWPQ